MYPECLAKTSVLRIREDLQALCDTVPCLPFLHTPHPQYLSISFSQTPCLFLSFKHSLFWLCHLLSVWTAFLYVFVLLTLSLHSGFRNFSQEKFFLSLRSSEELPSLGCLPETPFPLVFSTLNLPLSVILTHMPTNMSAVCVLKPNGCARQVKTLPVWSNIEHFWQRLLSWSITYFLFFKKCGHISQLSSWQHDHVAEHPANGLGWQWPLPSQARPKKTFQLQFSVLSLILGELDAEGLGAIRYN